MSSFKLTFYSYLPLFSAFCPCREMWFCGAISGFFVLFFCAPWQSFSSLVDRMTPKRHTHFGLSCCVEKAGKGRRRNMKQVRKACTWRLEPTMGSFLWWNSDFIEIVLCQVLHYLESSGKSMKSSQTVLQSRKREGGKGETEGVLLNFPLRNEEETNIL